MFGGLCCLFAFGYAVHVFTKQPSRPSRQNISILEKHHDPLGMEWDDDVPAVPMGALSRGPSAPSHMGNDCAPGSSARLLPRAQSGISAALLTSAAEAPTPQHARRPKQSRAKTGTVDSVCGYSVASGSCTSTYRSSLYGAHEGEGQTAAQATAAHGAGNTDEDGSGCSQHGIQYLTLSHLPAQLDRVVGTFQSTHTEYADIDHVKTMALQAAIARSAKPSRHPTHSTTTSAAPVDSPHHVRSHRPPRARAHSSSSSAA